MSESEQNHDEQSHGEQEHGEQEHGDHGHDEHGHGDHSAEYFATYKKLLVLFAISVAGPEIAHFLPDTLAKIVVLLTAFGIAFWKAGLVIEKFMHLGHMKRYITYLQLSCLIFMAIFVAAVSPDIFKHEGATIQVKNEQGEVIKEVLQWDNYAAKEAIARGMKAWEEEKAQKGDDH